MRIEESLFQYFCQLFVGSQTGSDKLRVVLADQIQGPILAIFIKFVSIGGPFY